MIIVSALFLTLYLGTVTMLHWGSAPLRSLPVFCAKRSVAKGHETSR